MGRRNLAVPVQLWALACTIIGISLTTDTLLTCVLTVAGFIYLGAQETPVSLHSQINESSDCQNAGQ